MQQKKYIDIERLKPNYCDGFHVGDQITIQEKVDGANFSIRYDSETDTIKAFSRKRELDLSNNLRGAWEWSQKLDKDKIKQVLGDNLILFMEWLVSHSVPYPQERYNNAYCYDIYDTVTNKWLPQSIVKEKVAELNLIYIPVFYEGEFISWEHIKSFVGRTDLGGEYGEGCFNSQTKILMADRSQKCISKIQIGDYVKSYNPITRQIENKKVLNVFYNGRKKLNLWYNIAVFPRGVSGKNNISGKFCVTKNHKFYCGNNQYSEIQNCNYVYHYGKVFDRFRYQAFLGLMLSDMHYSKGIFSLSQATNKANDFYNLFKEFISHKSNHISGKNSKITVLHFRKQETVSFHDSFIIDNKINYIKGFSELNDIGWAYFFMGDGYGDKNGAIELCVASYDMNECNIILNLFNNYFQTNAKLSFDTRVAQGCGGRIRTSASEGRRIMKQISKYIMPHFRYKIKAIKDSDLFIGIPHIEYGLTKRKIQIKKELNVLKTWQNHKTISAYDIEVEDNHNYFANGCLVHNCVVKNMTNLNSDNLKLPFYVKIVCEKFCETKGHKQEKPVDMKVVQEREEAKALVATVVTKARVTKLIHKMVDDGIIPENWDNHDMSTIAKNLGRNVYEDCVKEESEIVNQVGALFGKLANSTAMALAREILEEKENV